MSKKLRREIRALVKTLTPPEPEDSGMAAYSLVKSASMLEQRFTLGLAYPAMRPDAAKAADGHIDFVSEEVLEQTAWNWLKKYRDVGLFHTEGTEGHFEPTESYIWRADDWHTGGGVIRKGDWLLGGVWDEFGWNLVKKGLVNGWSPEGTARRSKPTAERLAQLRS